MGKRIISLNRCRSEMKKREITKDFSRVRSLVEVIHGDTIKVDVSVY